MNNVLVVANFSAGRKQAIKYRKKIQKFLLRKQVYFHFVTIDQLNEVEMDIFDTILAVGGDGTVNKVLPYLVGTNKNLGIIPCGTANLLAAKLGINNISKALKAIDKENVRKIDVMSINDKLSVLRCGIGYDADIIGKTPQSLKNKFGYFAYFITGIIFALRFKEREYKMLIDGEQRNINASCIIFANAANMYRNIVSLAHSSTLDDGLMDIFVLKTSNPIIFFFELLCIILKIRKNSNRAEYIRAKDVNIENSWLTCHIDGEKINFKENIRINILDNAIEVFNK